MKKTFLFTIFSILIIYVGNAQVLKYNGRFEKQNGNLFLIKKSRAMLVDTKSVTVKLKPNAILNKETVLRSNRLGYIDLAVPDTTDVQTYVAQLEKSNKYELIKYNFIGKICVSTNDSFSDLQWHLDSIYAPDAWAISMGSPNVKVAVLDVCFAHSNPDLDYGQDNYKNYDASLGYDYTNMQPLSYHGNFVSGIIAAKTNNYIGVAGVAGGNHSPGACILPFSITSSTFGAPFVETSVIDDAIHLAVDNGAKIINMSFSLGDDDCYPDIEDAIDYAYNHGVTLIAASGNDNSDVSYPASSPKVIAVGGLTQTLHRASSSNYGIGLDLCAPSENICSLSSEASGQTRSGTSFAAPQVAGVVALMLSLNPNLTPSAIKNILINSTIKIEPITYTYDNSGWNEEVGYGLINACEAVVKSLDCPISGLAHICKSSPSTYSIGNIPSCCSVSWTINNNDYVITPSGNQCSVTYTGSQEYAFAELTAQVHYNNYVKHFIKSIIAGTPPFVADLQITGGDGSHVHWTSNLTGNTVDIEELLDLKIYYSQFEANLYKMSASDPYDTLINHWSSFMSRHLPISNTLYPGWYLLQVRGTNDCGTSDWVEVEIECVDTYMPRANGSETELSLMYNRQAQMLTVAVNHTAQSRPTIDGTYTIQLWNEMNMVREFKQKDPVVQIPMSGLKNGLYTVRYVNNDEVVAKKFFKH